MLSKKTIHHQNNISHWLTQFGFMGLLLNTLMIPSLVLAANPTDSEITFWVKDALAQDARINSYAIDVTTKKGIVTLSGTLDNLAGQKYALLETEKIEGVVGVINEMVVLPRIHSDTDIWNAVHRRILNSTAIKSEGILVTCVEGKVTLSGKVDSYSESQEAELIAKEVSGVKEVKNLMTIEWTNRRSDMEIKNDVLSSLKRDVYLSDRPLTVSVVDARVTLTGNVSSVYEKERAYNDARWIENVKGVDNQLKIEPWTNNGERKQLPVPSNTELTQAVREELDQDIRLNAEDISVDASFGGVILNGVVYSQIEKQIAEEDTHAVTGVGWVSNHLLTRVDEREDWAILDDVQFDLDTDSTTEGFDIHARVNNGIVTLTGNVHTWYEQFHAREIASKVKGVKGVVNQIALDRETSRSHSVTAVVKDIQAHFQENWIVRQVRDRIHVAVEDGTAILTGEVDTWAQRTQAEEVAFNTEGVWKVENHLKVKEYNYDWENWYSGTP